MIIEGIEGVVAMTKTRNIGGKPKKNTKVISTVIMLVGIAIIIGVIMYDSGAQFMRNLLFSHAFNDPPLVLHDIAHDVNRRHGFTIYIPEHGEYMPYLVLTTDYNGDGNVLLLRKHLLDEMRIFNYRAREDDIPEYLTLSVDFLPSYYRTSHIDSFLNGEFLESLSAIQDVIVNSDIVITDILSIGRSGRGIQIIHRKVFLLSLLEVRGNVSRTQPAEGRPIEALRANRNWRTNEEALSLRIATTADGVQNSWWLRTPVAWYTNATSVSSYIGGISLSMVSAPMGMDQSRFGVRPAFCLPRDTPIREAEIDGERVFKLDIGDDD